MGSIRQQFSIPGNVEMSLFSCDFIRNIDELLAIPGEEPLGVQFVEGGYLFLASEEGEGVMRENYETQRCGEGGREYQNSNGYCGFSY